MAVATALATGTTLFKGLSGVGDFLGIGGSSEEGSGTVQRGTLAHAIDKFEKANDFEAIKLANLAVEMRLQGASESQVAERMARELGYSSGSELTNSWKWAVVSRRLQDAVTKARQIQNQPNNVVADNPVQGVDLPNISTPTIQPVNGDTAPGPARTEKSNLTLIASVGVALLAVFGIIFFRG